ncbi:MAG: exodeoxyribonuclease VII small subunit [Sporichthyaceae bacterium]
MASDGATAANDAPSAADEVAKSSLDQLDYEAARAALIEVVAALEAGNLPLEESLALWERGEQLATICRARLDGARARLDAYEKETVPDGS